MSYNPQNPNGQATSDNSAPVVIASDQSDLPISAASLPLPSGAATAARQDTGNTSLATIATNTGNIPASPATTAKQDTGNTSLASIDGKITAVDTGAVTVASSALPSGAATSAKQSDGTQKTQVVDGSGNVIGATSNALDVNVKSSTTLTVASHAVTNAGTFAVQAAGGTAAGSSLTANPLTIGGRAATTMPTAVTDGQVINAMLTKTGKQVVRGVLRENIGNQQTTITSSVAETTIVTADATYKLDLYGLILTNTSATATKVTIKDSTGGTTRMVFQVPATETRGFMLSPDAGHKQNAANNNWTVTCGTSVASLEVTAMFTQEL
jgi:hypothetical protein